MTRARYTPRLTWRIIVPVRWRHHTDTNGRVRKLWRYFLFGHWPIWQARREDA